MVTFKEYNRLLSIEEAAREFEGFFTKMINECHFTVQGEDIACIGLLDRLGILQESLGKEKVEYIHGYTESEYTSTDRDWETTLINHL